MLRPEEKSGQEDGAFCPGVTTQLLEPPIFSREIRDISDNQKDAHKKGSSQAPLFL